MRKLALVRNFLSKLVAVAVVAVPVLSQAARPSPAFQGRPELDVASGAASRTAVSTSSASPHQATAAWVSFQADAGGQWQAIWDSDTGVPLRIFGTGIDAPGSVADPARAERYTRDLLSRHIALLAPGNSAGDFVLVSNEVHRGVRTVGFKQFSAGLAVIGGQLSFRFKADRLVVIGSEALPAVQSQDGHRASARSLQRDATRWILKDSASTASASSVEGPFVLPIIRAGSIDYHTVMAVTVEGQKPIGKWRVYLDADTGDRVAREQTLRFAESVIRYNVPVRSPLGLRAAFPAQNASLVVDGEEQESDADGRISWEGIGDVNVNVQPTGPLVNVMTQTGVGASATLVVSADTPESWNESGDETLDAQLSAFVHARIAKEAVRVLNPDLSWLDTKLPVYTNIDDSCNAFSDGNSINFFLSNSQCGNTAQLADVVYHEFGHSMHANSIIEGVGAFDGAFSEGLSDYLAASITNDPAMGVGFFKSEAPLRHIDPASREHIWPDDVAEIHYTGLIFAGAMWDLRKLFVERLGEEAGAALANQYFYAAVQRGSNIPATYVEILLEDDDDGNLANGTPNVCDINAAFGSHGLRTLDADAGNLSVVAPNANGYEVEMSLTGLFAECPGDAIASANINWLLREDSTSEGDVEMIADGEGYRATIPAARDGDVVRYKIDVEFVDGTSMRFPANPADPRYEFYVGEVIELYCTDFETDPFADGWTHGLSAGEPGDGADDWAWGPSLAAASSGDAPGAFSGEYVIGNDLGGEDYNGKYQSQKTNFVLSPKIDVSDYSDVRLQYRRWLTVEDGFFDQASIYSNDELVWTNFNSESESESTLHHQDSEWRFHDVSLTGTNQSGTVQIKYEIDSDGGLEFGGWTVDDFCIVANANAICGDGELYGPEQCDQGSANSNTQADACRTTCLAASCGDGVIDTGESCDDGNTLDGDGCESTCLLPGEGEGDCGCVVGAQGRWPPRNSALVLLGFVGLMLLRRRRR